MGSPMTPRPMNPIVVAIASPPSVFRRGGSRARGCSPRPSSPQGPRIAAVSSATRGAGSTVSGEPPELGLEIVAGARVVRRPACRADPLLDDAAIREPYRHVRGRNRERVVGLGRHARHHPRDRRVAEARLTELRLAGVAPQQGHRRAEAHAELRLERRLRLALVGGLERERNHAASHALDRVRGERRPRARIARPASIVACVRWHARVDTSCCCGAAPSACRSPRRRCRDRSRRRTCRPSRSGASSIAVAPVKPSRASSAASRPFIAALPGWSGFAIVPNDCVSPAAWVPAMPSACASWRASSRACARRRPRAPNVPTVAVTCQPRSVEVACRSRGRCASRARSRR